MRAALASLLVAALLAVPGVTQAPFDHGYGTWDGLLRAFVRWLPDGGQSRVDYAGFDRARLKSALDQMGAVTASEFGRWNRPQRLAFLINAYNAFTVELILSGWPDVSSIKDLGSFLRSPWQRRFFQLLGARRHLDWIEHEQLRPRYAEPRLHAAVNCASIGCPALRPEAFVASRIDGQLDDSMRRFLGDRTRNRVANRRLEVSEIFKWYRADFEQGHLGLHRIEDLFARYADALTDDPGERAALVQRAMPVTFLPYNWALNVAR